MSAKEPVAPFRITVLCPNCAKSAPVPQIDDPESVKCWGCGWETDTFEVQKQADLAYERSAEFWPKCWIDGKKAVYYAPHTRRFFCVSCGPFQGLKDSHKLEMPDGQ